MKQYRKKVKQPKQAMGQKRSRLIANIIIYTLLGIMSVVWIIPFVCLLFESLRCESQGLAGYVIPQQWGFDNYIKLLSDSDMIVKFRRWYLNTFVTAVFTAVFQTIFVLAMSYTLSRLRFKGRKFLMNFMLILGMFPGFLSMIILYFILKDLGLTESGAVGGLILVYTASSGMGYYVCKGFFDTIPKSLDEAARIDGATRLQVMTKVILPLSKPIVIYTILTGQILYNMLE